MTKKENNQVTVNANGHKLVPVSLRVNPETIEDGKVGGKPVVYKKIGVRKYPCIIEMVTEEEYRAYMQIEWAELKAEEREKRCLIPDKKGGFIMCPECNKCSECKEQFKDKFDNMHAVSIESFIKEDEDSSEGLPIKSKEKNDGEELMFNEIADVIEEELRKIKPKYALIFREMFNGNLQPNTIAKNCDLKVCTTYKDVPKVMEEAQKIFALLMK